MVDAAPARQGREQARADIHQRPASGPVRAEFELECEELDSAVGLELSNDRVRANEGAGSDQHSIVAPTQYELG